MLIPSTGETNIRSTLHKFLPFLAENGVRECRFWRKIHSVNILLMFPWHVEWIFCCHPRLHHWLLSRECSGRGLVEEHSTGSVFSMLCCTAGLQWDRQRKPGLSQWKLLLRSGSSIPLGLRKSCQLFWGWRKPDRGNEHSSEMLLSREGSCGMKSIWSHKLVSVYLQAGGLVLQNCLLAPKQSHWNFFPMSQFLFHLWH